MPESSPFSEAILAALQVAVFERVENGRFRPVGDLPRWVERCRDPVLDENGCVELTERFPYLLSVLEEPAGNADQSTGEPVRSGIWIETDSSGEELPLEATLLPGGAPHLVLIDLLGCARSVASVLGPAAALRCVSILEEVGPNPSSSWTTVGEPLRAERVMFNILENAIRYSLEGGTIRIALNLQDGGVEVSVEDEGPGVPEAVVPGLFKKFGQYGNRVGKAGLGLYFCNIMITHRQVLQRKREPESRPDGPKIHSPLRPGRQRSGSLHSDQAQSTQASRSPPCLRSMPG